MKKQLIAGLILVSLGLSGQALALEVGKGSPYDYRIKSVVYILIPLPVLPLISWLRLMKAM